MNDFGFVSPRTVPNDNASPGNVSFELIEKCQRENGINVDVLVEPKEETDPATVRGHDNSGNG